MSHDPTFHYYHSNGINREPTATCYYNTRVVTIIFSSYTSESKSGCHGSITFSACLQYSIIMSVLVPNCLVLL